MTTVSRRFALHSTAAAVAGGAAALTGVGRPEVAAAAERRLRPPLSERATTSTVGKKWAPDASPLRFRGNTFVHHLDPDSELARAAAAIRRQLMQDRLGPLFATLPPDTYHVTFLDGTDESQRTGSRWPADLARDLPMDQVSRRYLAKLGDAGITAPTGLGFAVEGITDITDARQGLSISLVPDDSSAARLRAFRARLLDLLQLDVPLDGYDFHVTIAYRLYANTEGEVTRLKRLRERFATCLPESLRIDGCDFSTFENMVGFPTLLPL